MKNRLIIPCLLALLLLPGATPSDRALTIRYESKPDSIVIYPGNLIYGVDRFSLPEGQAEITLPALVIPESVMLFDTGKPLSGYKTKTDPQTGRTVLVCDITGTAGKALSIEYLLRGASWNPVYNMTILADNRVRLDFSAAINNGSLSVADTEIRLLSGLIISSDLSDVPDYDAMTMTQNNIGYMRSEVLDLSPATAGVAATGEHYLYKVGKLGMEPGERLVTGISVKELAARKILVWDTRNGDRTEAVYKITNDTGFPLPPGMVRIYQDGIYTGSDNIEWTPSGGEGSLTAAGMTGLRVRKQVSSETVMTSGRRTTKYVVTLTIENLAGADITLTVLDQKDGNGSRFEYGRKPEEQPGNILRWEVPLGSGKKETITYNYITGEY